MIDKKRERVRVRVKVKVKVKVDEYVSMMVADAAACCGAI